MRDRCAEKVMSEGRLQKSPQNLLTLSYLTLPQLVAILLHQNWLTSLRRVRQFPSKSNLEKIMLEILELLCASSVMRFGYFGETGTACSCNINYAPVYSPTSQVSPSPSPPPRIMQRENYIDAAVSELFQIFRGKSGESKSGRPLKPRKRGGEGAVV